MSEKGKPLTLGPDQLIFGRDIVKEPAKELAKESEKRPAKRPNIRPRFLHRARAEAQKLGLKPRDDYEAIDLLKERGIDILAGAPNVLPVMHLPANPAASQVMPNVTPVDNQERMREIARIQRDLVRRRRRRLAILMVKLAFFVFLPTAIAGWYFARGATPMYETFSEFVIQKADPAAGSAMTGLLAGTALATAQDSMIVQGYLTSREAMQRLDHDHGFRAHFSNPAIDPIQRLPADASEEAAYKLYKNQVTVGFDTTEGILRMSVIAATPEISQQFSEALVGYAEERVDQISQRVREGQMKGARESYDEAEAALKEAQRRMLALQEQRGVLSTEIEVSSQMSLINPMQLEVENKQLELQELMTNPRPNATKAALLRAEIGRLEDRIAVLRSELTENSANSASLAKIAGELNLAETDFATRQLLVQQALGQMETARIEANRQVRYLAMGVAPVAPDVASYPRVWENTALAFLIFAGIYLLVSLTVSILREQVSV